MSEWIPINGYKEIPIGHWAVQLEKAWHGTKIHIASVRPSAVKGKPMVVIAGAFGFDAYAVVAYRPLPEEYKPEPPQ